MHASIDASVHDMHAYACFLSLTNTSVHAYACFLSLRLLTTNIHSHVCVYIQTCTQNQLVLHSLRQVRNKQSGWIVTEATMHPRKRISRSSLVSSAFPFSRHGCLRLTARTFNTGTTSSSTSGRCQASIFGIRMVSTRSTARNALSKGAIHSDSRTLTTACLAL